MAAPSPSRRSLGLAVLALGVALAPPARGDDPPQPQPQPAPQPRQPVPPKSPARILPPDVPYPPIFDRPGLRRPLVWEGQRFSALDWAITGAGLAVTIGSAIARPRANHWTGGAWFDEDARDFLRLGSAQDRYNARDASDVLLSLEATWPFFVDSLILAWFYHGSPDAAAEMALIDGKALSIVTAVQGASTVFFSRERPYGRDCGSDFLPGETRDCTGSRRYRSFFSGHTSTSFMSASLICVHHLKLSLFGSATADALTCVAAYGGATATALFRAMGDVHYATDLVAGALVGTAIGIGVPLLHYRKRARRGAPPAVEATLMPFGAGLAIGGTF